jgi:hypothetical protein
MHLTRRHAIRSVQLGGRACTTFGTLASVKSLAAKAAASAVGAA